MSANIAGRVAESVSVTCPVCGQQVPFRPIIDGVVVKSANAAVEPHLLVSLQPGNFVKHACQERPGSREGGVE